MKSLDKILNYLLVFLVIAIAGSFFYFKQKGPSAVVHLKAQSENVDKVVNKYLQEANYAKSLEQVKIQKAVNDALKKAQEAEEARRVQEEEKNVVSAKIPTHEDSLQRADKLKDDPNLPTNRAANNSDEIDFKTMSAEDKAEYKRVFVENAKAGGYLIELNDKMEVIKSTPIRKPSKQDDVVETAPAD